jgi:hypothetical protein
LPLTVRVTRFRVPDIKRILSAAAGAERQDHDPRLEKFIGGASLAEGRLLDREGTTAAPVYGPGSGQASGRELKPELCRKKLRDQFMLTDCGPYRCR